MSIHAKIILDSTNGVNRLTTWVLTYPRFIHSELMTHRDFSRNAASSRAIPLSKMRQLIIDDTAIPVHWGQNQKGMQATSEIQDPHAAREWWLKACASALALHREGEALGLHKQVVNRVIEPFMTMQTIVTATRFSNFFALRKHSDAEPNIRTLAQEMYSLYKASEPTHLPPGDWHLPFITQEDLAELREMVIKELNAGQKFPTEWQDGYLDNKVKPLAKKVSVGRCCRVSYLNHEGKRNLQEDIDLHDRLAKVGKDGEPGHWSPFEHVAMSDFFNVPSGNFLGWMQYRKQFENECIESLAPKPILLK